MAQPPRNPGNSLLPGFLSFCVCAVSRERFTKFQKELVTLLGKLGTSGDLLATGRLGVYAQLQARSYRHL